MHFVDSPQQEFSALFIALNIKNICLFMTDDRYLLRFGRLAVYWHELVHALSRSMQRTGKVGRHYSERKMIIM